MLNENIIKDYSISLYMEEMNKIHKTKALFNQKDSRTSVVIIQLLNNKNEKNPINLTGCKIVAKILKSDNTTSSILCSILDAENGYLALGMTEQALLVIGDNVFELEIQYENQILYSPKMSYTVVDNLYDESPLLVSQDEFPVLNSLIYNVQLLEKELVSLDAVIDNNEDIRSSNEELRKENEVDRIQNFENIKSTIEEKVNLINQKMQDIEDLVYESEDKINKEIIKINGNVDTKISEVNAKIVEINGKLSDIDEAIAKNNKSIEDNTKKIDTAILENIQKVDLKISEVNSLIDSIVATFDSKILEVNNKIKEYDNKLKEAIDKVKSESTLTNNTLTSTVNNKISEVNAKSKEMENKVNQHVDIINEKISNYDERIGMVDNLNTQINVAEQARDMKEIERNRTIQDIINILEVTQSDIDDILGMIGGL